MIGGGLHGVLPPSFDVPSLSSAQTMAVGEGVEFSSGSILGRIDQYELLRKLGGGGFGVVYLARDTVSGVDVAIKTLHPLLKGSGEEMERLREKFALVHGLTHPNIAKALVLHPVRDIAIVDDAARHELRLAGGDSVMIMDYAPGVTLSKWRRQFKDGKVPFAVAVEIGRQLASALDYAHGERIVHRDIKPSNVVVETLAQPQRSRADLRLRARILDFGLAAEIRSSMSRVSTETGDTSGTRPYMAPEQWLGKKQDGRTDQYALACVLYELISGAPPFAGVFETGDPVIMRTAVERDVPEDIESIPAAPNAALLKALSKQPQDRFASCGEFVAAMLNGGGGGKSSVSSSIEPGSEAAGRLEGSPSQDAAAKEADVLRRKLYFARAMKAIPSGDRIDNEFSKFVTVAENEMAVVEEACKYGRFAAAAESLERVESVLDDLRKAHHAREDAAIRVRVEAEQRAREESARKVREEAVRRTKESIAQEIASKALRVAGGSKDYTLRNIALIFLLMLVLFFVINYFVKDPLSQQPFVITDTSLSAGTVKTVHVGSQTIRLHYCPAGSFTMGSPLYEIHRDSDEKPHRVTFSKGYWMGETEVTQGLWVEVMGTNPSYNTIDEKYSNSPTNNSHPVEQISWDECQLFLQKLNARSDVQHSGLKFALPSEAEWEYACRAGTLGKYGGTEYLDSMGWYSYNSGDMSHPVGKKQKNAWGLYDMHGNVWEWCSDRYSERYYAKSPVLDPQGPEKEGEAPGELRVRRGGSYADVARYCRSACRSFGEQRFSKNRNVGFRLLAISCEP